MNWVIQDNFYSREGHERLLQALGRLDLPFTVVRLDPSNRQLVPDLQPSNPVIACGSTTMCQVAASKGWSPGSFLNENFDFRVWGPRFGEMALNSDAKVVRFRDVRDWWPRFFVRVVDDSKAFPGAVMSWADFSARQKAVLSGIREKGVSLEADTMVLVASPKDIQFERRFFVVDSQIVANSQYRVAGRPEFNDFPDEESDAFVRAAIERFSPARAFAIDVAGTPNGIRIVEINCFNSAAFYACNVGKLVESIERMSF